MAHGQEDCTGSCPSPFQLQLYQTIIFATPVLFAFMLLLMFCLLYFRRQGRAATIHSQIRAQLIAESLFASSPLRQGLSISFREKLPIVIYDEDFKKVYQVSQCAVCLSDYQMNEKIQQLPVCKHSFHVPCINEWLAKNATCPICRLSLNQIEIGSLNSLNEAHTMQGTDATRMWEERVVNEAQEGPLQIRPNISNVQGIQDRTLSEHDVNNVVEHTINIERS
ncbi:hypothetical protein KP509_39G039800 [Ceratopteris richardii]|uniref:RING-type domain-containing protein n=1 Tax=Ceratopteris richardii TaxID=49495 RepID=A0A8T2Q194_CERRI|nr:hypothetical protein KP509_39G039800 [Ceratopteris richardii]